MPPELGPLESEAQPFKKFQPDVSTVLYSLTLKKKKKKQSYSLDVYLEEKKSILFGDQ